MNRVKVIVEGIITSIQHERKDDKENTKIYLVQDGEREQVVVRMPGDQTNLYSLYEVQQFSGRLLSWKTREGVRSMVLADA